MYDEVCLLSTFLGSKVDRAARHTRWAATGCAVLYGLNLLLIAAVLWQLFSRVSITWLPLCSLQI